ncbi:hypothetical protein [Rhizobium oryzicola]|uniref:Phenylacetate--CoA ligase family protein n=1 Tax=Rhizobium oryzicola TaxID=1232668 RepID=A0ABT8SWG8_9HYPH|nr:hypothetical protein [Rhizobium oryzicola]MDO1582795.1 hypothetical protein [Rhizobium oryzicola]
MKAMDILRGLYVRSPRFVQNAARPLVSLVPTQLKFGRSYADWRQRISRAAVDPAFAADQHLVSLRKVIAKAQAGSPFYRDQMESAFGKAFDPSRLMPEDVRRLPVQTKSSFKAAGDAVLAVPRRQLDRAETSGSNGEPSFAFYLDKDRSPREMAFVYDGWSRIGFDENTPRASFRGFAFDNESQVYDWDPALKELRCAVFPLGEQEAARYVDEIDRRQIQYFYGYPSAIELFCRRLVQIGRKPQRPILGILPISEPLYDHQRRLMRSVLGPVQLAPFYGLSEKVAFAIELEGDEGIYEFNPLYGLTELLDEDDNPVTEAGREGRIVATGFLSTGMPFIRYDTRDFARLVELPTADNGYRLRIAGLAPRRKPGFLISFEGQRIAALDIAPEDPEFFKGISEYQFYQNQPGIVIMRYILSEGGSVADVERMANHFAEKVRHTLSFEPQQVTKIAGGRSGKRAFIDQQLDLEFY